MTSKSFLTEDGTTITVSVGNKGWITMLKHQESMSASLSLSELKEMRKIIKKVIKKHEKSS